MSGVLNVHILARPYLLEARLLETGGRSTNSMEGCRGGVDEVEELVCSLWASAVRHGHGAEGGERAGGMWTMDCTD